MSFSIRTLSQGTQPSFIEESDDEVRTVPSTPEPESEQPFQVTQDRNLTLILSAAVARNLAALQNVIAVQKGFTPPPSQEILSVAPLASRTFSSSSQLTPPPTQN